MQNMKEADMFIPEEIGFPDSDNYDWEKIFSSENDLFSDSEDDRSAYSRENLEKENQISEIFNPGGISSLCQIEKTRQKSVETLLRQNTKLSNLKILSVTDVDKIQNKFGRADVSKPYGNLNSTGKLYEDISSESEEIDVSADKDFLYSQSDHQNASQKYSQNFVEHKRVDFKDFKSPLHYINLSKHGILNTLSESETVSHRISKVKSEIENQKEVSGQESFLFDTIRSSQKISLTQESSQKTASSQSSERITSSQESSPKVTSSQESSQRVTSSQESSQKTAHCKESNQKITPSNQDRSQKMTALSQFRQKMIELSQECRQITALSQSSQITALSQGSSQKKFLSGQESSQKMVVSSQESSQKMIVSSQEGSQKMVVSSQEGSQKMVVSSQESSQNMVVSSQGSNQTPISSSQETYGFHKMIICSQESSASQKMVISSQESSKSQKMITSSQESLGCEPMIISSQESSKNDNQVTGKEIQSYSVANMRNLENSGRIISSKYKSTNLNSIILNPKYCKGVTADISNKINSNSKRVCVKPEQSFRKRLKSNEDTSAEKHKTSVPDSLKGNGSIKKVTNVFKEFLLRKSTNKQRSYSELHRKIQDVRKRELLVTKLEDALKVREKLLAERETNLLKRERMLKKRERKLLSCKAKLIYSQKSKKP